MVRSRAHVTARSIGSRGLKNVAEPLGVYALSASEVETTPRRKPRKLLSVAIVGFVLAGSLFLARGPILAWFAINVPRVVGANVQQQIGFATTPDGVRIAYATAGEGPPIVFVLGWLTHLTEGIGSPLYDQGGTLSWWTREHRVVRYDGRGFGLSDRNVTDFSLEARVRDLETVVDALGLERFIIYAYSAGGATGIEYANRHPEKVSRLVLAATFVEAKSDLDRIEALEGLGRFIDSGWDAQAARSAMAQFLAPEADEVSRRMLMHFLGVAADGPQIASFMRASRSIDASGSARALGVPTLVIAGDADSTVPLAASRRVASLIPGARFEVVEGAGHIAASLADPRVMKLTSAFLADTQSFSDVAGAGL
jgi:pimeloyl-ACP methyl ester carboxylesterase